MTVTIPVRGGKLGEISRDQAHNDPLQRPNVASSEPKFGIETITKPRVRWKFAF